MPANLIPPAPISGLGLLLSTGFILEAWALASWDDVNLDELSSFYQRHTVAPPTWKAVLLALMGLGGIASYTRGLYDAVMARDASTKRRVSDACGFFLFAANLYVHLMLVIPREQVAASYWRASSAGKADADTLLQLRATLVEAYQLAVGVAMLMLVQQWVSFSEQGFALPKSTAKVAPAGNDKRSKRSKKTD